VLHQPCAHELSCTACASSAAGGGPRSAPGIRRARKAARKDVLAPYSTMPPTANTHPMSTTTWRQAAPVGSAAAATHAASALARRCATRQATARKKSAPHNVTLRADGLLLSQGPQQRARPQPQRAQPHSHFQSPPGCEGVCRGSEYQIPPPFAEQARCKHTGLELHCCFRQPRWQGRRGRRPAAQCATRSARQPQHRTPLADRHQRTRAPRSLSAPLPKRPRCARRSPGWAPCGLSCRTRRPTGTRRWSAGKARRRPAGRQARRSSAPTCPARAQSSAPAARQASVGCRGLHAGTAAQGCTPCPQHTRKALCWVIHSAHSGGHTM